MDSQAHTSIKLTLSALEYGQESFHWLYVDVWLSEIILLLSHRAYVVVGYVLAHGKWQIIIQSILVLEKMGALLSSYRSHNKSLDTTYLINRRQIQEFILLQLKRF